MTEVEVGGIAEGAAGDAPDRVAVDRPAPHTLLLTVRGDLAGPRDGPAARQIARLDQVDDAEGEHEPGRGAAHLLHPEADPDLRIGGYLSHDDPEPRLAVGLAERDRDLRDTVGPADREGDDVALPLALDGLADLLGRGDGRTVDGLQDVALAEPAVRRSALAQADHADGRRDLQVAQCGDGRGRSRRWVWEGDRPEGHPEDWAAKPSQHQTQESGELRVLGSR